MGHLLKQIITLDNLSDAWEEVVANDSGPGVDGVSLEDFARDWEANLIELREAVRGNRYRPAPLLRFSVPKRDGSPRLLTNPTVRDKILQRAVLRVLDDLYEETFLDCSFAYRPRRSVQAAVERVVQAHLFGRQWVLDLDIDDFFHSLDHRLLLRFLGERVVDEGVLTLIKAWLKMGRPDPGLAVGTPLGMVVSPLLSNIYLHYLDLVMMGGLPAFGNKDRLPELTPREDWVYVRYADDFVVLCRSQAQAELAQRQVAETLAALRLALEPAKTRITTFSEGFEYLGCYFKDDYFCFQHGGAQVKVLTDADWGLFYRHGPEGYR
ncbi:MAG: RNA-directed DNA polymerase [Anaerolineales bacterium]|nr:RNA-directed DNA polymerase [Anaerolineales bacterium]